jgi:hypothetical protein
MQAYRAAARRKEIRPPPSGRFIITKICGKCQIFATAGRVCATESVHSGEARSQEPVDSGCVAIESSWQVTWPRQCVPDSEFRLLPTHPSALITRFVNVSAAPRLNRFLMAAVPWR